MNGWTVAGILAHLAFWDQSCLVRWDGYVRDGEMVGFSDALIEVVNEASLPIWLALPVEWRPIWRCRRRRRSTIASRPSPTMRWTMPLGEICATRSNAQAIAPSIWMRSRSASVANR